MLRWIINGVIFLLPALVYLADQLNQGQIRRAESEVTEQSVVQPVVKTGAQAVERLSYPDFGPLRSLPQPNHAAIASVRSEARPQVQEEVREEAFYEAFLQELDLAELSPELTLLVQQALATDDEYEAVTAADEREKVDKLIEKTAQYRGVLPPLNLQMHMYSTDSHRRWVKINDQELTEGEWLGEHLQLVQIEPRHILIRFDGQLIEIPHMYEWQG